MAQQHGTGARLTHSFTNCHPVLSIPMAGVSKRIPFPSPIVSINLMQVSVPFEFAAEGRTGFLLIQLETETPNILIVNGVSYYYTWCLVFGSGAQTGRFEWFTQGSNDDRFFLETRFLQSMRMVVQFVCADGTLEEFPPTPAGTCCSVEIKITPYR